MACYHLGVLKALFEQNLLPEVITGTSGGSIMAAFVCCRTDQEIIDDGIFTSKTSTMFKMLRSSWSSRIKRFLREGYMFDQEYGFNSLLEPTKGHMTFLEAYKHSGRILCITVTHDDPVSAKSPPIVLNFLTV